MKTADELKALKAEVEAMSKKLAGLTDGELEQVAGGRRTDDPEQYNARREIGLAASQVNNLSCVASEVRQQIQNDLFTVFDQLAPWHLPNIDFILSEIAPIKAQLTTIIAIDPAGIAKKCVDYLTEAEYWMNELRKRE